jgi:hypothetical protein
MRKNVKLSKGYSKLSEKRLKVVNRVQKKCRAGYIYKGCISGHVTTDTKAFSAPLLSFTADVDAPTN